MIPPALLNESVTIKRRVATGVDSLNNPVYGTPTLPWPSVYTNMPVRLAFSSKNVRFAPEGERILPTGVMYYNPKYQLKMEDRVLTSGGIEYVVIGLTIGYGPIGKTISHFEAVLQLP